jgi:hypothetical protein
MAIESGKNDVSYEGVDMFMQGLYHVDEYDECDFDGECD